MECTQQTRSGIEPVASRITIERTFSGDWCNRLAREPAIHAAISDDASPPAEQFDLTTTIRQPDNFFLLVRRDGKAVGYFGLLKRAPAIYEVHTVLSKACRGQSAIQAGCLARDWMFGNAPCLMLVSYCPDNTPQTLLFAKRCGFTLFGQLRHTHTKNGVPHNTTYVYCVKHEGEN